MTVRELALRWVPRATEAEVTLVEPGRVHIVLLGPRVRESDAKWLASVMGFRLACEGLAVTAEARDAYDTERPERQGRHSVVPGGGRMFKIDQMVLEALADCPMTLAMLRYRLPPRGSGSIENALLRRVVAGDVVVVDEQPKRFALTSPQDRAA